jgi:hypothetical protein
MEWSKKKKTTKTDKFSIELPPKHASNEQEHFCFIKIDIHMSLYIFW